MSWKILLDENVSPSLTRRLNDLGIDAYHARDRGLPFTTFAEEADRQRLGAAIKTTAPA